MKAFNTSENFKTCETDECESLEKKKLLSTAVLKPGKKPNFNSNSFVQIKENPDNEKSRTTQVLQDEEAGRNWLPDPCFVHLESMDFQTPKATFLPSKPNIKRKHL